MRARTVLSAVTPGRATFLVAGAALGIGAYGFVATLAPYSSGRVPQPVPVSSISLGSEYRVSASEPQAPAAPVENTPEQEAVERPVPAPQYAAAPAPRVAAPQVEAAATDSSGVAPLDPPTPSPTPGGFGPIVIDPETVIVPDLNWHRPNIPPHRTPTPRPRSNNSGEEKSDSGVQRQSQSATKTAGEDVAARVRRAK